MSGSPDNGSADTAAADTARLRAAADRVDAATRSARQARIAAGPDLRARARRRSRLVWALLAVAVCAVLGLGVATTVLAVREHSARTESRAQDEVLDAAGAAVVTMLTADPADPEAYVERVLAVTAGAQHDRIAAVRAQLVQVVAGLSGPSVGQVISAGLSDDPSADARDGSTVGVLMVADATDPALVGGGRSVGAGQVGTDQAGTRITLRVVMVATADGWRVAQAVAS